jgi:hypothetical protein
MNLKCCGPAESYANRYANTCRLVVCWINFRQQIWVLIYFETNSPILLVELHTKWANTHFNIMNYFSNWKMLDFQFIHFQSNLRKRPTDFFSDFKKKNYIVDVYAMLNVFFNQLLYLYDYHNDSSKVFKPETV